MMNELEVIPFYTRQAQQVIEDIVEDTKQQMKDIEELNSFVSNYSVNNMPETEEFLNKWKEISQPDEEYDFFQERLEEVKEEQNLPEIVYADMYDEFTLLPEYEEIAATVVSSMQQNDVITPPLAGQLQHFLSYSHEARKAQIEDFQTESRKLERYEEELTDIVESFEDMNSYEMPLDVDRANDFWDRLDSFDERVQSMVYSRETDFEGEDYNSVNLYGFLQNVYEEELGLEKPVEGDLNAVNLRVEEARDNIII